MPKMRAIFIPWLQSKDFLTKIVATAQPLTELLAVGTTHAPTHARSCHV